MVSIAKIISTGTLLQKESKIDQGYGNSNTNLRILKSIDDKVNRSQPKLPEINKSMLSGQSGEVNHIPNTMSTTPHLRIINNLATGQSKSHLQLLFSKA